MDPLPRGLLGLQRRYLFTLYLLVGSLLIVAGTLQTRTMTVQLFDMTGRKLYESSGAYRNTTISTASLPRGVYTLRCTGDRKENFVQRFVK